jgi:hypothetical protein
LLKKGRRKEAVAPRGKEGGRRDTENLCRRRRRRKDRREKGEEREEEPTPRSLYTFYSP